MDGQDVTADGTGGELEAVLGRFAEGWDAVVRCGPGWNRLVADCDRELAGLCDRYVVYQIKEKFGGLRYYFSLPEDVVATDDGSLQAAMLTVTRRYEEASFHVCEHSGRPGVLMRSGSGWLRVVAPDLAPEGYTPVTGP